jgi:hypothetical protein
LLKVALNTINQIKSTYEKKKWRGRVKNTMDM